MLKLEQALPLLGFLGFLQIVDTMTINLIPGLEVNPVTLFLFAHLGAMWWLPKLAISLMIAGAAIAARRVPRRTLSVVTAGYTVAVAINLINVANLYLT